MNKIVIIVLLILNFMLMFKNSIDITTVIETIETNTSNLTTQNDTDLTILKIIENYHGGG